MFDQISCAGSRCSLFTVVTLLINTVDVHTDVKTGVMSVLIRARTVSVMCTCAIFIIVFKNIYICSIFLSFNTFANGPDICEG